VLAERAEREQRTDGYGEQMAVAVDLSAVVADVFGGSIARYPLDGSR
jgi:hypothetical protein